MDVKMEPSWKARLSGEFEQDYFVRLTDFVRQEYRHATIYPRGSEIFNAFAHCPFDRVKVVIIGQDPYHEPGQAHGLCFSVQDGTRFPPSLVNIFKEITDDVGAPTPKSGNLTRWADQGVLLLNATLTVRAHAAGSSRAGLGDLHRRRHPQPECRPPTPRLHALGCLRTTERRMHRHGAQPRPHLTPPLAPLGTTRLLWQPPLQPRQRLFSSLRPDAHRVVG